MHAGRGIPALGRHVVELCRSHPGANVILAHAGICDLAWIWRDARELPNLFFDTSWWSAGDLLALMSLVPPGQVLLASDAPYGSPTMGAVLCLRSALQAGLDEEAVTGDRRRPDGAPAGRARSRSTSARRATQAPGRDLLLDRVWTFLTYATGQALQGVHPTEAIDLARLACEVGDEAPEAPVCEAVLALLENTENLPAGPRPALALHAGAPAPGAGGAAGAHARRAATRRGDAGGRGRPPEGDSA